MAKSKLSPIPTINLSSYQYLTVSKDSDFLKYVSSSKGGINYDLCEYINAKKIKPHYSIVQKLRSRTPFGVSDINDLESFTKNIGSSLNCDNVINNFKQSMIDLPTLFNETAGAKDYNSFEATTKLTFTSRLKGHFPYLFSIIKHCQDPNKYPIKYKQWVNLNNYYKWSTIGLNEYDNLCNLYNVIGIPSTDTPKHVYFAAYIDYLAQKLLKIVENNGINNYDVKKLKKILNTYKEQIDDLIQKAQQTGSSNSSQTTNSNLHQANTTPQQPTNASTLLHHPLNLILYGPPGTGKTYNTLFHALAIIENKKIEDLRAECNALDKLHKSDPKANPHDGFETLKLKYDSLVKDEQIVFTTFHQSMSYEDFIEGIKPIPEQGRILAVHKNDQTKSNPTQFGDGTTTIENLSRMRYEVKDGIFKQLADTARMKLADKVPYVLIIDEINRGNVSQIFGELITLIEKNKRLGEKEELTVKLPYSSSINPDAKPFGVPNNLYIIGTMNTADRSVEALDTALRRRFSFEEMMPKPSLLEKIEIDNIPINLPKLLETINKRIVVLKDREHQIGHSYFMGHEKHTDKKEWLSNVFKDKIIPLLQEYFFGDYKKIYLVLGEGFVKKDSKEEEERKRIKEIFGNAINPDDFEIDIPDTYEIIDFDIVDAINKLWGGKATETPSEEKAE